MKSVEQFDVPRHTARIDFHDKAWAGYGQIDLSFSPAVSVVPRMRLCYFESTTLNV